MGRTKQTTRRDEDNNDDDVPPPPSSSTKVPPPPPPPPPPVQSQRNEASPQSAAPKSVPQPQLANPFLQSSRSSRQSTALPWSSMPQSSYAPFITEAKTEEYSEPNQQGRSALRHISGDDLIVGKSRLKSVDRTALKPVQLGPEHFHGYLKEKGMTLFAAKSFLVQTIMSRNLSSLTLAGLDQLNDLFFKLLTDANVEMKGLILFDCSGCVLMTDVGLRWLNSLASGLKQIKVAGCPKVTSASLALLLKRQSWLTDIDVSGCGITTIPVQWGESGAGIKVDGCPLVCPSYFRFIQKFKTSAERKTYVQCCNDGLWIYHVNHFKVVVLRQHNLDFSLAKYLKDGATDTVPEEQPLTVRTHVPLGNKFLNIYEINRMQMSQDLFLSDGCICLFPFALETCNQEIGLSNMITYLSWKVFYALAKRLHVIPVLVGINTTSMKHNEVKNIMDSIMAGVKRGITTSLRTISRKVVIMTGRSYRIDELDVHGQLYVGEAAATEDYLNRIKIFGEVLHVDEKLDHESFLHNAFKHFEEDLAWMCVDSTDARDLSEKHMMNHRISRMADIAAKAEADAKEISFYTDKMTYPCLEQVAVGLHRRGLAVFSPGVKGSPYVSDLDWFAKVLAVVMDPPQQDETLAKQIRFVSENTPAWTDKTLREALGNLVTDDQYLLVVKLLKSCGCLIEVKIDRLTQDMPSQAYMVGDKLPESPKDVVNLEKLWPASLKEPRETVVQIDKFYRFGTGITMSLMSKFYGRCAKFFKFTLLKKFGILIRKGGMDLLVDAIPGTNGYPVVVFSCRLEDQPLESNRCRQHCMWSLMNLVTTIMDYTLKEEGIFANITVPCPTCIPGRERTKIAIDPDVYRYFLHLITSGKDRGLRCRSQKYDCYQNFGSRTQEMLIGPEMDFVPKHLSYMLADVSSSLPKLSRCTLCQNCAVNGKSCGYNGLQEGSVCHCGCKQYPKMPICPSCGICWKCTNYLKKMYYSLHPQSIRHARFTAFDEDLEEGKLGKEEKIKISNSSVFQVSNLKLYVLKNVKFVPEKFNRFDVTTFRGNHLNVGVMGTPPKGIYGPLLTYSLQRGSIGKDWKFETPIATDPAWVGKSCTSVSFRIRYPDEDDMKAKELDYQPVIVDIYKMGVKIWSEYLHPMKMEVAIFGEGSCGAFLGAPTISTEEDPDRYHPDSFKKDLYVELDVDESTPGLKEGVLVCPVQSAQATGILLRTGTNDNDTLLVKNNDKRIHPLGHTFSKRRGQKVYLLNHESKFGIAEEPVLEFENLDHEMEQATMKKHVAAKRSMKKLGKSSQDSVLNTEKALELEEEPLTEAPMKLAVKAPMKSKKQLIGKGGTRVEKKIKSHVEVESVLALNKWVDQGLMKPAPLWMFSDEQRADWEPSVIDLFSCRPWYQSAEAMMTAFIRSKNYLEETVRKCVDSQEGDGLALLMFPEKVDAMKLRFQIRPYLLYTEYQLFPLCSTASQEVDVHLMNIPGISISSVKMSDTAMRIYIQYILPLQVYMATQYKAILPDHDVLLGNLNLDEKQVLYWFRELLLQLTYSMMMTQVDNPVVDVQEAQDNLLSAMNSFKKKLGFKEGEILKCPAHKLEENFNPADVDTVPGLKSYTQFMKTIKLSQNVESLPDDFLFSVPRLQTLNAEISGMSEFPKKLELCKNLTELKLAGTKISELPMTIIQLKDQLTYLDISRTQMQRILPNYVSSLTSLKTLIADYLFIGFLPDSIGNLQNLERLSLKGCCLRSLPASFTNLKNLTSLSMSGVHWLDVKPGFFVTADFFAEFMTQWNLTEEIMKRREEYELLMKITTDKTVTLDQKEVGHLNAILYQTHPRLGYYGDTEPNADSIGGFPPGILELENLTHLDLSFQGIVSIPDEIAKLTKLNSLILGSNPYLTTLPGALGFLPLQRLVIDDCPSLRTPPPEICSKGFAAVLAYLRRLVAGSVSCKRTKLMMVGLGGAGKTSLVRALMSGKQVAHLASGEAITDGIDIHTWTVNRNNDAVTYSVWDFAGQTVYYNTHQFFLSNRAVYLLLWNIRLGYEHAGLDFWLSSISVHSPQAPILVVGTHLDQVSKFEIPTDELAARYPQIVGFHFISTFKGTGVGDLEQKLLEVTLQQKYMGEMIPEVWLNFEQNILSKRTGASVIDYKVVEKLAVDSGIFESVETSQAVHFLHDLGTLQHFENEFLRDRVVINPQWIVDVMACVISVKDSVIKEGRLKHRDIGHIWKDFPTELHEWLLRLTEEFDLTFPLPDQAMNLVPSLLPEKEPKISWPEVDKSTGSRETIMEYEFAYLPVGLFNRGQVRLYEYSDSSLIWKRGSLLKKNGHLALITQTRDSKLIVKCQGPRPENILFMVHEVFETLIQESFQGVHYDFKVPCPECLKIGHEPYMFNGSNIRRATGLKAPFLQCVKNFHIISIADLNGICPPDDSQDYDLHLQNTVRSLVDLREELSADIFISYCAADIPKEGEMVHPKRIRDCLEAGGYRCWFDDRSGRDVLEERVLALRDAKIFLVMMSSNYINDQTCCNMFKFARTVLKKPLQLVTVGPQGGNEWKQSALGMLVTDEVYVNLQRVQHFEVKSQELLKVLSDKTIGLVERADKPECFISYCWRNSQRAVDLGQKTIPGAIGYGDPRDLKDYLEEKGVKTWIDIERAGKGGLFEDIAEGLRDAKVMIACVSDEYADSLNCQMEFRFAAKALGIPVIIAVYGTGHRWRSTEIGMLSLQYLQVSFQDRVESAPEKIVQFVKSHTKSKDPRDLARSKNAKDEANKKYQKTSYQELYELAQRKFLRQVASYADVYELQPYPRLIVVDFAEPEADDKEDSDVKKEETNERPKLIRRQTSMMLSTAPFLQRNLCFRILCEHEQGWHLKGEPIPVPPGLNQKMVKYAPYLARVMAVVRHSPKIQLNCVGGVEGEKYIKWLEENCGRADEGSDVKEAYQELRKTALEADTEKTLGHLARCHLASGKVFWLCKTHQAGPRMTILSNSDATITHAVTDSVMESFMLENLKSLDHWEKQAEVVMAEMAANPKPKKTQVIAAAPTNDEVKDQQIPEPKPIVPAVTDEQKPKDNEQTHTKESDTNAPGPSKPLTLAALLPDEPPEDEETPVPPERPESAQSRTSVQDTPVPTRRSSTTSSRRPSVTSKSSPRTSETSLRSMSEQEHSVNNNADVETPRSVNSEAMRRFRTAGIVAQTVNAAIREERRKQGAVDSKACYIL